MQYIIFDVDGTLTKSTGFDKRCFKAAVLTHVDVVFKENWGEYQHVTDAGILKELLVSHGLSQFEVELTSRIKQTFIDTIRSHIRDKAVDEIQGAGEFIHFLRTKPAVRLAFATGGWGETAQLKLASAGIDVDGMVLCSSNDALSRTQIMTLSLARLSGFATPSSVMHSKVSYFGDASWDKKACAELGWNFILVGNSIEHSQSIRDFQHPDEALKYL